MISPNDLPLLYSFIERESFDFERLKELGSRGRWINFRIDTIQKELKKCKYNFAVFRSLSNLGICLRSLQLEPQSAYWDWKKGNVFITLCSCGRDEHWGTISQETPEFIADLTAK